MTTHDPDDVHFDDGDGLDALDFPTPELHEDESGLDVLSDFEVSFSDDELSSAPDDVALDAVTNSTTIESPHDDHDDFGSFDDEAQNSDEDQTQVVQAINPPGTVAVTAYLNGSVAQVDLDPKVTTLTETQLADEVRFVAAVAAAKATALVHVGVVNMMVEQGVSLGDAKNFVTTNMPFATPEQAHEADLALIARHTERED